MDGALVAVAVAELSAAAEDFFVEQRRTGKEQFFVKMRENIKNKSDECGGRI